MERSVGVLEWGAVEFVENWKESCTRELEKYFVEKRWTRVLYRSALSSSKVDDRFIVDVQDSVR